MKNPKSPKTHKKNRYIYLEAQKKYNGNTNEPNAENSAAATQQLSNEQQAFPRPVILVRSGSIEIAVQMTSLAVVSFANFENSKTSRGPPNGKSPSSMPRTLLCFNLRLFHLLLRYSTNRNAGADSGLRNLMWRTGRTSHKIESMSRPL